jgi:hypothetical protein
MGALLGALALNDMEARPFASGPRSCTRPHSEALNRKRRLKELREEFESGRKIPNLEKHIRGDMCRVCSL